MSFLLGPWSHVLYKETHNQVTQCPSHCDTSGSAVLNLWVEAPTGVTYHNPHQMPCTSDTYIVICS